MEHARLYRQLSLAMFNSEDIIELWTSSNPHLMEVAAAEMVRGFDVHSDLFFRFIDVQSYALRDMAASQWPFLRKSFLPVEDVPRDTPYDYFDDVRQQYDLFVCRLQQYVDNNDDKAQHVLATLYTIFEGIRQDIIRLYPDMAMPIVEPTGSRQLMVFVTGFCNLRCPYCFSREIDRKHIDVDKLDEIIDWSRRNNITSITPCGGEPLLYNHILYLIDRMREEGMTTYFATNFTIDISRFDTIDSDVVTTIYVHLTRSALHNQYLRQVMEKNIAVAKTKRIEVIARANLCLSEGDFYREWVPFLVANGFKHINLALTIPTQGGENDYIPIDRFRHFVPMVEYLVEELDKVGITYDLAKPVPLCFFSHSTARRLLAHTQGAMRCNISEDDYMKNVCISPSLVLTPCLGVSSPQIPFSLNLQWDDVVRTMRSKVVSMLSTPTFDHCTRCYLWQRRLCQGVCLSYKDKLRDASTIKNHLCE